MTSKILLGLSLVSSLAATPLTAQTRPATAPAPATAAASAGPRYGAFGVDLTARDTAVKPGDDFWTYANGQWDKTTPIAADRQSAGPAVVLSDEAELQVRRILEEATSDPAAIGPAAPQIGALYASFMDQAAIERAGTAPLAPYFAKIDAARDRAQLQRLFATVGYASPVEIGQLPDPSDPTRYVANWGQGSLGMGGRDYYLLPGAKYDAYRAAYRRYVEQVLTLAGISDAAARADRIVALETAMAKVQWSPVEQRDLAKMLKPMTVAQRRALAPEFDFAAMETTAGYRNQPVLIVSDDTALTALGKIFAATPVSTWQDWMKFRLASSQAAVLPKAFDDASFAFYGRTLSDQPEQRARWKRGVALVNGAMGEAVGKVYVARFYPPESEAKMAELIKNLRGAYRERIEGNSWMDAATKQAALAKLAAFEPRTGHPATYIDYSSLKVVRGDPLGNNMRAAEFEHQLDLSRFPKPVDRSLWGMTPQTVNAYYDPLANQITFPAAILQPPFFDPKADVAVNYGAIGAVIGHEMGHGFDDQGSQFSASGKFENWWTPATREAFTKRTGVLVGQYDQYEPIPGVKVKGALTLGENIGDLGGIEAAYSAYQRYQAEHGKAPVIDGLTGDQRFFLAYAQAWRSKIREGALRARLLTDPHSPAFYRVNGIVRNVDAWYDAFAVKPGDKLYLAPKDRVKIW
ncbi:M13 family metallopeptidase [Sphingomonas sp. BK069]|uniref:M13 family metallopeptidase n=1 Tax=Sphingomonas sp. BK069 TaxID=2586979 RepID=UPI00160B8061|nr:M13 family metallopeptidase [Sphingomonas sp. BK069]MBB3348426.1 endothelin-converting enzyme/putative endopeptidase [Sphingomonas sp. BK069]